MLSSYHIYHTQWYQNGSANVTWAVAIIRLHLLFLCLLTWSSYHLVSLYLPQNIGKLGHYILMLWAKALWNFLKNRHLGTGDMAQLLKVFTALAEDPRLVPSTCVRQFITTYNSGLHGYPYKLMQAEVIWMRIAFILSRFKYLDACSQLMEVFGKG